MIEVIYKEEKQEPTGNEALFTIPRNIRQIGLAEENYRIYIEDYVYTFLCNLSESDGQKENGSGCLAVLTGETKWWSGITYLFVRGALMAEDTEAAAEHIDFPEDVWNGIYEKKEQYFPEQEIVGWFFSHTQLTVEMTDVFKRAHLKYFGGEKVLMLMNPLEREDAFFRYENNFMVRQSGYYIYYEKNPLMQAYMIEKNQEIKPEQSEEVEDEAVKNFRKIIKGKKEEEQPQETEEKPSVFSYAATACLAVAVLAVGVNFYQNYRSMQDMGQQAEAVSSVILEMSSTPAPTARAGETAAQEKRADSQENARAGAEESAAQKSTEGQNGSSAAEDGGAAGESSAAGGSTGADENGIAGTAENGNSADAADTGAAENGNSADAANAGADGGGDRGSDERTASDISGEEQQTGGDAYREESDVRKAKRREAMILQEQGNQTPDGQDAQQGEQAASDEVHDSYVIRPGDTLYQISIEHYGDMETIAEICELNGISEEEIIYPGQVIVLP